MVSIYRRWLPLCKDDIRNACLLAGLLNDKDSSAQFEQVWQWVWAGVGELGMVSTTFEEFAVELSRLVAQGYVDARNAYQQLYNEARTLGAYLKQIQTVLGDLEPAEQKLVDACDAKA